MTPQSNPFQDAHRIVIKIGSQLLVDPETGAVHRRWLETLGDDIAALRAAGKEVVIVSSGAIAVGRRHLGLASGKLTLSEQQASAATGMVRLAHAPSAPYQSPQKPVAQITSIYQMPDPNGDARRR